MIYIDYQVNYCVKHAHYKQHAFYFTASNLITHKYNTGARVAGCYKYHSHYPMGWHQELLANITLGLIKYLTLTSTHVSTPTSSPTNIALGQKCQAVINTTLTTLWVGTKNYSQILHLG